MAFRLKPHEPANKGIRRILHREIDHALTELAHAKRDENKTVHDVRTHCKKIRAILRLMRLAIGDEAYRRENRRFRDIARPLTEVRDAKIRIKTLDGLSKNVPSLIHKTLQNNYRLVRRRVLEEERVFELIAQTLRNAGHSLEDEISGHHKIWKPLRHGLRHTYRKSLRASAEVQIHATVANLHEWRKQTKYMWYQLQILKSVQPKKMGRFSKQCHKLTELLGDDHDLAVLHKTIIDFDRENIGALLSKITARRKILQKRALRLGKKLYKNRPKKFIAQFDWPK